MNQPHITLREVEESDIPIFFEQQCNPAALYMSAFTPPNPDDYDAFLTRWTNRLNDPTKSSKTLLVDGVVAGSIVTFVMEDELSVGYGLDQAFWGKGIMTEALTLFLAQFPTRPLYARVVKDNIGSRRVLEKCGFTLDREGKGFANARGMEMEEFILKLA